MAAGAASSLSDDDESVDCESVIFSNTLKTHFGYSYLVSPMKYPSLIGVFHWSAIQILLVTSQNLFIDANKNFKMNVATNEPFTCIIPMNFPFLGKFIDYTSTLSFRKFSYFKEQFILKDFIILSFFDSLENSWMITLPVNKK